MISGWGIRVITEPKVLKAELLGTIKACGGNRSNAALELEIPHRTFYNLLEALGIPRSGNQPRKAAKKKARK